MANIVVNVEQVGLGNGVINMTSNIVSDTGSVWQAVLELPLSILSGNAGQINTAVADLAKTEAVKYGIIVSGGDKVTVLGGAV